jgi:hypothetical protein
MAMITFPWQPHCALVSGVEGIEIFPKKHLGPPVKYPFYGEILTEIGFSPHILV